jgi:hypothetical protein
MCLHHFHQLLTDYMAPHFDAWDATRAGLTANGSGNGNGNGNGHAKTQATAAVKQATKNGAGA